MSNHRLQNYNTFLSRSDSMTSTDETSKTQPPRAIRMSTLLGPSGANSVSDTGPSLNVDREDLFSGASLPSPALDMPSKDEVFSSLSLPDASCQDGESPVQTRPSRKSSSTSSSRRYSSSRQQSPGGISVRYTAETEDSPTRADPQKDNIFTMSACSPLSVGPTRHYRPNGIRRHKRLDSEEKGTNTDMLPSLLAVSRSQSPYDDLVKIEIEDVGGLQHSLNLTSEALRRCKAQIIEPYWRLLVFIGWRRFRQEDLGSSRWLKLANGAYLVVIVALLLYAYIYEMLACQDSLDVEKALEQDLVTTTMAPVTNQTTVTSASGGRHLRSEGHTSSFPAMKIKDAARPLDLQCDHVVTTYIIPHVLHLLAFCIGCYMFRFKDNEQIYALMEKVFLQGVPAARGKSSQGRLINKLRIHFLISSAWVVSSVGLNILASFAFGFHNSLFLHDFAPPIIQYLLYAICLLGVLVQNAVSVAVVTNYCLQCEMILFYIKGIATKIREKSVDLKSAMRDILWVRSSVGLLNKSMANMMSLMLVFFAELVIIGVSLLCLNKAESVLVWVYRAAFPLVWAVMLIFPLTQAARLNTRASKLRHVALEARVFGHIASSQIELDSFLNFTLHAKINARLFHIPIRPRYLIGSLVVVGFALLLLFQTGVISSSTSRFI